MVIRVGAPETETDGLVAELARVFGRESVSLAPAGEIQVSTRGEYGALIQSLEVVQRWLEEAPVPSAEIFVDGRAYKLEGSRGSLAAVLQRSMNGADSGDSGGDPQTMRALQQENRQLRTALESRIVIEQAKGALSVTHGVAPDEAFELLRRQARSERRDIHLVAVKVLLNKGHFEAAGNGGVTTSIRAS